jgi:hypothetical protein
MNIKVCSRLLTRCRSVGVFFLAEVGAFGFSVSMRSSVSQVMRRAGMSINAIIDQLAQIPLGDTIS